MIKCNQKMNNYLKTIDSTQFLPDSLSKVLQKKFYFFEDLIVFDLFGISQNKTNLDIIKERYLDLSGFEYSHNKIHIDDYCKQNTLGVALLFLSEFEKKWVKDVKDFQFVAIIGFTLETEFGIDCTFTFHKKRIGETVIDLTTLEDFSEAILVATDICGE